MTRSHFGRCKIPLKIRDRNGPRSGLGGALAVLLALTLMRATSVSAAGVVGTGTAESCTEAALDAALEGGGMVTFDCGAEAATTTVTNEKLISRSVTIEGDGLVTLSGGDAVRVFRVDNPGMLDLRNLTVAYGRTDQDDGGGIYNLGTLTVTNSTFSGNSTRSKGGGQRWE